MGRLDRLLASSSSIESTTMPDEKPGEPNPSRRAASLFDLLQRHDLDFVSCAFVTLLGREPDPTGQEYYVRRLRAGVAKSKLLWQIRRSREGQAHNPAIAGLDRYLKRASWGRLPLIGWIARKALKTEADDRLATLQRAVLNELGALREQVATLPTARARSKKKGQNLMESTEEEQLLEQVKRTLPNSARTSFDVMMGAGVRADLD